MRKREASEAQKVTRSRKKRKGFSLVEMIAVAIMLAIITISCVLVSHTVSAMRIRSRNNILMSTHNMNVMEQLRQEMNEIGITGRLEVYYGFQDDDSERRILEAAFAEDPTDPKKDPDNLDNYRPNYSTYDDQLAPNTGDIRTDVHIDISEWDNFHIYKVRIESSVIGYAQTLVNDYVLTDIGIERDPTRIPLV